MAEPDYVPFPSFAQWSDAVTVQPSVGDFERLMREVKESADDALLEAARRRVTEYAAIETGALEGLYEAGRGFTVTVAFSGAVIEAVRDARGAHVARLVEDQLSAFEMVLDVATGSRPLTESFVRQLHEVICRHQETYTVYTNLGAQERRLVPGAYKTDPNNPFRRSGELAHAYAPVADVAPEMQRLTEEMRSDRFAIAEPVVQAAYAHYGLAAIHPFPDGNGRVARTFASIFTYRRPGVPLLVFEDEKPTYLLALEAADRGAYQPFVDFVGERVIESVELVREFTNAEQVESTDTLVSRLRQTLAPVFGELEPTEADALIGRVADRIGAQLARWAEAVDLPPGVTASPGTLPQVYGGPQPPSGFRAVVTRPRYPFLRLSAVAPANADLWLIFSMFVRLPERRTYDFLLVPHTLRGSQIDEPFGIRLPDIQPQISQTLELRLERWVDRQIGHALESLLAEAEERLRRDGYLT